MSDNSLHQLNNSLQGQAGLIGNAQYFGSGQALGGLLSDRNQARAQEIMGLGMSDYLAQRDAINFRHLVSGRVPYSKPEPKTLREELQAETDDWLKDAK